MTLTAIWIIVVLVAIKINMSVRKISGSWTVDLQFNGKRHRKKSPINTRSGAKHYETTLRVKLAKGEDIKPKKIISLPTFKEFAWKWFEVYAKNNNKASEIKNKEIALRVHLVPFFGKTKIDKITNLQIEEYKSAQIELGTLVNKSINNQLTILCKCMRTAQEWLELEKLPRIKKLKVPPQKFDFLTPEESEQLLEHAEGIWYRLLLLALKTGMRQGELLALTWQNINWETKLITVSQSMYNDEITSTKSNQIRHINMTSDVVDCLYPIRKKNSFIFSDEEDKHFSRWRINETLERICKKANLRRITCHVLRHSFASHLSMAGASIQSIQQLLGHSDIQTTMRYAHLNQSVLKSCINLLDPNHKNDKLGLYGVKSNKSFNEIIDSITISKPEFLTNNKQKQLPKEL
jgi:integrase